MHRECFDAIKSLRSNDKIIITKSDKGSGVVILNKSDYITKMKLILNDASKFQQIGPADTNDNSAKIEAKIQRRLLQLSNGEVMHESVYKEIRPTGSLRPRLYGLPKVHKIYISLEFSFNNNMYKQIDGAAMGSPLSVALANIFVGYHESKLFGSTTKPFLYHRYVDDTFAIFGSKDKCTSFLDALNSMHLALKFTFEKEENDQLPFLDVLVEKSNEGFLTSVFRKPTFTEQYFRWDSFGPTKRKTNLIETLVHRAFMICSKSKL